MPKQTAKLIDGKTIAADILAGLKKEVAQMKRPPGLAVILIGDDPASKLYVRNKKRAAQKIGVDFHDYFCGGSCFKDITEKQILEMIDFLNQDKNIDGIIVQLPIPKKFNAAKIIQKIIPEKDVDGFHNTNKKNFLAGKPTIVSPLLLAIKAAITSTGEELKDKKAVIVVNNPVYSQDRKRDLENIGLKVKLVKPDKNLADTTKEADVLVVILGKKNLIKKSMVKPKAIVIDVGTNWLGQKTWTGDVDQKVIEVADWLTPVPGGIGPMTIAFLLKNTVELAKKNQN